MTHVGMEGDSSDIEVVDTSMKQNEDKVKWRGILLRLVVQNDRCNNREVPSRSLRVKRDFGVHCCSTFQQAMFWEAMTDWRWRVPCTDASSLLADSQKNTVGEDDSSRVVEIRAGRVSTTKTKRKLHDVTINLSPFNATNAWVAHNTGIYDKRPFLSYKKIFIKIPPKTMHLERR